MSRRLELRKENDRTHGHTHGRPRTGKLRKLPPPKSLTDDALCILAYLVISFPSPRYAADVVNDTGIAANLVDYWLPRLAALNVVNHKAMRGGYRPSLWLARPGRRGLGASPAVKSLLATYLAERQATVQIDSSHLTDTEQSG